jgi:hypothetical protein
MSDPVNDLKQELLAAAERQHEHIPGLASRRRLGGLSGRSRLVMAAATLAIAAAVALIVTAPWESSPGFLARAQAALTHADSVLHMKTQTTTTWTRPDCKVRRTQAEVWIDETPPHSYRLLLNDGPPDPVNAGPQALGCSSGTASEYGGTYEGDDQPLRFEPPNRLSAWAGERFRFPLDPAAELRAAISAGRARDEGKTQLDGRTVERIRIDPPPGACRRRGQCPSEPLYVYVDPETFYPVEFDRTDTQVEILGGPGGSSSYRQVRARDVTRYLTFEYLPRTAANLALTDIHAQHPDATGP